MSSGSDRDPCETHYIATGLAVPTIWLATALILWILRNKSVVCVHLTGSDKDTAFLARSTGTKDPSNSCEMTPVTENEDTLVYHQLAFTNGNRKPRERNPEDDVTYAQIKISSQQEDGIIYADVVCNRRKNKADKAPKGSDAQTTYAEIKPISRQPQPQGDNTGLYAAVVKKNTENTKAA